MSETYIENGIKYLPGKCVGGHLPIRVIEKKDEYIVADLVGVIVSIGGYSRKYASMIWKNMELLIKQKVKEGLDYYSLEGK